MKKVWDQLGMTLSAVCIVHCLMVAFLPFVIPVVSRYSHSSWIHFVMMVSILLISPLAFIPGFKKHRHTWILGLAVLGLFFIILGILIEGKTSDQFSHAVSILGSLLLVLSHFKNLQHSHRHGACCSENQT